jgi:hypothetical protein
MGNSRSAKVISQEYKIKYRNKNIEIEEQEENPTYFSGTAINTISSSRGISCK